MRAESSPRERTVKRRRSALLAVFGGVALFFVALWALLFARPTLPTPRFLAGESPNQTSSTYRDGIHTQIRQGGAVREFPATTVTEEMRFDVPWTFDETLELAEQELTAARGWDLSAIPQDKIARFSQRSTNMSVSIYIESRKVRVTVAQTRFASIADRMRNWWKGLTL